jgi:hypothetical protein
MTCDVTDDLWPPSSLTPLLLVTSAASNAPSISAGQRSQQQAQEEPHPGEREQP